MKFFRFSLTFHFHLKEGILILVLVLKEGLFGTAASLIPYFLKVFIIK